MDDDDGLAIDDVIGEVDALTRATGLAEALLAPCDFDCVPASPDRIRAVLRERYDEGLVDLVLKLVAHYCPPTSPSWRQ
jgi:hypothetical protein